MSIILWEYLQNLTHKKVAVWHHNVVGNYRERIIITWLLQKQFFWLVLLSDSKEKEEEEGLAKVNFQDGSLDK